MNKFLDDEIVKKIYKNKIKNDTPCYIYDLEEIKNNVNNITNYMPNNFSLYYAIKANPNKEVLKFIKSLNRVSGFEIASAGELIKALEFCTSKEVIFTGPGKTVEELEKALLNNIRLINIESIVEAIRINQIAEKNDIEKVDVLIRVNMDYKIEDAAENMGGLSTKMGIDESKYMDSLKYIKKLSHINIKGIHVFSASGILNYKASVDYARYVFEMVKNMENLGEKIDIIDLGGGLGVDYTDNNISFDTKKYFIELKKLIDEYGFTNKEFILELGCYLVASAGYYLSKIVDIKESKGYKHIILAGGLNHIPTATLNGKHPFKIISMNQKKLYANQIEVIDEIVDIDGPLCTAEDKVLWDVHVEKAQIGDIVIIRQAGAYCYSAAWLEFLSHEYPVELIINNK